MLVNQFKSVQENFNEFVHDVTYSVEKFKNLPFIANDARLSEYEKKIQPLLAYYVSRIQKIHTIIDDKAFEKGLPSKVDMHTIHNEYLINKIDKNINIMVDAYFNQFMMYAEGLDTLALQERIEKLKINNTKQLSFLKDMSDFSYDYATLEEYIKNEVPDSQDQHVYIDELHDLLEQYKHITSKEAVSHYTALYHAVKADILNPLFEELTLIVEELKNIIKANNFEVVSSLADIFENHIHQRSSGNISQFLVHKNFENVIKEKITLNDNQKIQEYIVFNDCSVVLKKQGNYVAVKNHDELKSTFLELKESIIGFELRKKPKIAKIFLDAYKDNPTYFVPVILTMNNFIENEQILKNMKFDFNMIADSDWETVDDQMTALVKSHKLHQYANGMLSNKNKHLLTEKAIASFKVLIEASIPKTVLQEMIGKKLAAIKTSDEFEAYLDRVVEHFSSFNYDNLRHKLDALNITPVYNLNNDVVVFQVKSFEDSKILGSPSWCIARDNYYFDDYTSNGEKQYFLYDFSKDEKDNESMIGFTVNKDGSLRTQHLKNDDHYSADDFLYNVVDHVLYEQINEYNLTNEQKIELEQKFNKKQTHNLKLG